MRFRCLSYKRTQQPRLQCRLRSCAMIGQPGFVEFMLPSQSWLLDTDICAQFCVFRCCLEVMQWSLWFATALTCNWDLCLHLSELVFAFGNDEQGRFVEVDLYVLPVDVFYASWRTKNVQLWLFECNFFFKPLAHLVCTSVSFAFGG